MGEKARAPVRIQREGKAEQLRFQNVMNIAEISDIGRNNLFGLKEFPFFVDLANLGKGDL